VATPEALADPLAMPSDGATRNVQALLKAAGVQFTPGPWSITDYGVRDRGGFICATTHVTRYQGQDERYAREVAQRAADVRLIASAPVMVLALMHAIEWHAARSHDEATDAILPKSEQYSDMRYLMEVVEAALDRSIYG
jgi:hypothetical protein